MDGYQLWISAASGRRRKEAEVEREEVKVLKLLKRREKKEIALVGGNFYLILLYIFLVACVPFLGFSGVVGGAERRVLAWNIIMHQPSYRVPLED